MAKITAKSINTPDYNLAYNLRLQAPRPLLSSLLRKYIHDILPVPHAACKIFGVGSTVSDSFQK
jgi:hypothetical protein